MDISPDEKWTFYSDDRRTFYSGVDNANRYNLTGMQYQPPAGQEPPDPPHPTIAERLTALERWAVTQGYQPPIPPNWVWFIFSGN